MQIRQFPHIYFGSQFIGGLAELRAIHSAGMLHSMQDIKKYNSSPTINLIKENIEEAMKKPDIPNDVQEALRYFFAIFENAFLRYSKNWEGPPL